MCQNNTQCSSDGIVRVCYREPDFTSETFFCDCVSWYGFVGENCDEPSATLYYYRTTTILTAIMFFILMGFTIRTLVLYIQIFSKRKKKSGEKLDPVFYLLLLTVFAAFFIFLLAATRIPVLFDPSLFKVKVQKSLFFEDEDDVESTTRQMGKQFLIAGSSLMFLAELQIILSWLRILITFSQTFPESYGCIPVERLSKILKFLLPVLLVAIALLAAIGVFNETALLYVVLVLLNTVGYTYGYFKFIRVLEHLPQNDTGKKKVISLVKTAFQFNMVGNLGVFFASGLYYAFVVDYINIIEPGTFNFILIFYDLAVVSAALLVGNLSWYSHVVTVRLLNIEQSTPWVPKLGSTSKMSFRLQSIASKTSLKHVKKESITAVDSADIENSI